MSNDYPKMLYKSGASDSEVEGRATGNPGIGYKTVQTSDQEHNAKLFGWSDYQEALDKEKRRTKFKSAASFLKMHFKFIVGTSLTIAGLLIAYLALVKQ